MRDPEQPRTQIEVASFVLQRGVGTRHRALQRVLRVLVVAQDRAAVAIELVVMTLVGDREGRSVATNVPRAEAVGAAQPQREGNRGHGADILTTRTIVGARGSRTRPSAGPTRP